MSGIVLMGCGVGLLIISIITTVVACAVMKKKKRKLEQYLREWY